MNSSKSIVTSKCFSALTFLFLKLGVSIKTFDSCPLADAFSLDLSLNTLLSNFNFKEDLTGLYSTSLIITDFPLTSFWISTCLLSWSKSSISTFFANSSFSKLSFKSYFNS